MVNFDVVTCEELREQLREFAENGLRSSVRELILELRDEVVAEIQKACSSLSEVNTRLEDCSEKALSKQLSPKGQSCSLGSLSKQLNPKGHHSETGEVSIAGSKESTPSDVKAQVATPRLRGHAQAQVSARNEDEDLSDGYRNLMLLSPGREGVIGPEGEDQRVSWNSQLKYVVDSQKFEYALGAAVFSNALLLGFQTEMLATKQEAPISLFLDRCFCLIFLVELTMRLAAHGACEFFTMKTWKWNVFDMSLVSMQVWEQISVLFSHHAKLNVSYLRMLRLFRMFRIVRLMRALHLFDELRVIVSAIQDSASALGWGIVLLFTLIYVFTLVLMQVILGAGETEHHEDLQYWFGSVSRAMLTLFECVVGGVSWDEVVQPIIVDVSPYLGVIFCLYISIATFAMCNILTGVFVDQAMRSVREDTDSALVLKIKDNFFPTHEGSSKLATSASSPTSPAGVPEPASITWKQFQEKVQTDEMQDYFQQIGVDLADAPAIFDLLDTDGQGSLSERNFVDGCLRLRGSASALDMAVLMADMSIVNSMVHNIQKMLGDKSEKPSRQSVKIES